MTPSTFTIGYLCHHGRSNTKTITRRPIQGSQTVIRAITVDAAQKTTTRRPHRGSQSAICVITVDPAQKQRIDDPIEVHNRRAAVTVHSRISVVTVDATQNHDWMTPSRSKIGSLSSRLVRHKKERPDDPIDFHDRLFVPSRSMRHNNNKNDSKAPSRFTIGALPSRFIRHQTTTR